MARPKMVVHGWVAYIEGFRPPGVRGMPEIKKYPGWVCVGRYTVSTPDSMRRKMWKKQVRFDMKWILKAHRAMGF